MSKKEKSKYKKSSKKQEPIDADESLIINEFQNKEKSADDLVCDGLVKELSAVQSNKEDQLDDLSELNDTNDQLLYVSSTVNSKYKLALPKQKMDGSFGGVENIHTTGARRNALHNIINELLSELDTLDSAIEYCGVMLRISQPPITGKFDIRWWKIRPNHGREPVLVKWIKLKGRDKWTTIPIKRIRTAVDEIIIPLREETALIVDKARELIERRRILVKHVGITLMTHKANMRKPVSLDLLYLNQLNETVVKKLMELKYPVDGKYFPAQIWGSSIDQLRKDVLKL